VSEVVRRVGVDARIQCGDGAPLMLIAGPCVAESLDTADRAGRRALRSSKPSDRRSVYP
jgi:3-deoxy-D-manno-octulosonic acid (KDO) 8-phosphate synthase